ncbi:MAG: GntR family transcriptional regulator [Oscillospiraceae bacterium]|nr:GntR family transcriptional regulator [Oscillospiraceae bacterium]
MSNYIHSEIEQVLAQRILNGEYAVGSRVPSEYELMKEFFISRNTATRVLNELKSRGLIRRYKGKGSYVTASKITQRLMAAGGDPRVSAIFNSNRKISYSKVLSVSVTEVGSEIGEFLHLNDSRAVRVYRLRYAETVPQMLNETFFDPEIFSFLLSADLNNVSLFGLIREKLNIFPYKEDMWIEITYLGNSEAKMLCQETGAPAFLQTTKAYYGAGEAFCFNRSTYRADTMRFSCTCNY